MTACPASEGTFTICSFWLVSALVRDRRAGARPRLCERLLSFASPLDLFGEEIDPETGRHLGNFPQAFTHLALINAVMHVIHAEQSEATPAPLAPRAEDEDDRAPSGRRRDGGRAAAGRAASVARRRREWQRQRRRLRSAKAASTVDQCPLWG